MQRAYSLLTIKSVEDGDERVITGLATTPTVDRGDDIVEPDGAVMNLPIPLLWQHQTGQPIGQVTKAKVTKNGIEVVAKIAKGVLPYIDEAWALIKSGLVRGFSIGFNPIESTRIEGTFGRRFVKWEWLELSAVTIPMNAEASIQTVKSIDQALLRASGKEPVVRLSATPGLSGQQTANPKGLHMKTIQEQIAAFEAKRAATVARRDELMSKAGEEGRTLETEEATEHDELGVELKKIDEHLVRLRDQEKTQIATATNVTQATTSGDNVQRSASEARGGGVITVKSNLPKGTGFARYVQALALSKGNLAVAAGFAKRWRDSTPEVETVLKSAMDAGTTTDATWAEPLVVYQTLVSEFIDILRPATILGRLDGLRRVPFNIRVGTKTQASTVGWAGQGLPKPVSELAFNAITLGMAKAAGIVVITQELARSSSPAAEEVVRNDLRDSMAQFLDEQFIDPAVAAVADVSPAAITNGLSPVASTGSTIAAIDADVASAFGKFITAELAPSRGIWVMSPLDALKLSLKRTAQDLRAYPDININGGTWYGLPVITSSSVPSSVSGGSIIVLMDASEVYLADDGAVVIDVSQEASLQMNSTPSNGAQSLVSLWQNNLIGVRAERFINWARRRDAAVTYIDGVHL